MKKDIIIIVLTTILAYLAGRYHQTQIDTDHRVEMTEALVYEMSQNQRVLKQAVAIPAWYEEGINLSMPSSVVSTQVIADPTFFSGDMPVEMRHGLVRYVEQIEAVRLMMSMMSDYFVEHGKLNSGVIENFDKIVGYTLAVLYPVQSDIDTYLQQHGGKLGYHGMVEKFESRVAQEQARLDSTIVRPK